jgi:hypothetical protein
MRCTQKGCCTPSDMITTIEAEDPFDPFSRKYTPEQTIDRERRVGNVTYHRNTTPHHD